MDMQPKNLKPLATLSVRAHNVYLHFEHDLQLSSSSAIHCYESHGTICNGLPLPC